MKRILFAAALGASLIGTAHAQPAPRTAADRDAAEREGRSVAASGDDISADGPGKDADEAVPDPSRYFNFFNFSYLHKDEMGGEYGDGKMYYPGTHTLVRDEHGDPEEEEPMSAPFIFALINFGILLLILGKYGGAAARKLAEERHDAIKSALDEAGKLRDQAAAKLTEYEVRLKDSDAEIKKLVDGMRADAEAEKTRILAAAEQQAQTMKREAEARIAAEIQAARQTLAREVTAAAAAATEKILRERLTGDDQNRLVGSFLAGVESSAPTQGAR